jgi:hypothetical protein
MSLLQAGLSRRSPVFLPAPLAAFRHRVQRAAPGPVPIGILMENGFQNGLQIAPDHFCKVGIPSGRSPMPLAFGIITRRTGGGK